MSDIFGLFHIFSVVPKSRKNQQQKILTRMMHRSANMLAKRALFQSAMKRQTATTTTTRSPLSFLRSLPAKAATPKVDAAQMLPGEAKRTVIDPSRPQPEYESPYSGPPTTPNTSGVCHHMCSCFFFAPFFFRSSGQKFQARVWNKLELTSHLNQTNKQTI